MDDLEVLRAKTRGLNIPDSDIKLRLHRAVSWLRRSDSAPDTDAKYIFQWISFNAAYAKDGDSQEEWKKQHDFFSQLARLDTKQRIFRLLAIELLKPVKKIMSNKYLYYGFWNCVTQEKFEWEKWTNRDGFERDRTSVLEKLEYRPPAGSLKAQLSPDGLARTDVAPILHKLFSRLYELRNQFMHGSATQQGSLNRPQVDAGAEILGPLVQMFLSIMVDNPKEDWGRVRYPVRQDIREDRHSTPQ